MNKTDKILEYGNHYEFSFKKIILSEKIENLAEVLKKETEASSEKVTEYFLINFK